MTDIIKLAREAGFSGSVAKMWGHHFERFAELVTVPMKADAERWRYSVTIGGNQTMNWLDVYDDWDGDGDFTDQIDAARAKEQTP